LNRRTSFPAADTSVTSTVELDALKNKRGGIPGLNARIIGFGTAEPRPRA